MSFSTRLKERREYLNMSRAELASKIGVTQAAIGNYENGISSPKEEILYRIFDALAVEPNYLWQDEMKKSSLPFTVSYPEQSLIKKYRALDTHGKDIVDTVLEKEYERIQQDEDLVGISLVARSGKNEIIKVTRKELEEINKILDEYEADPDEEADKL
ncbi:helix-turn-helix domain-containing protein [Fumia xinanensis]|uniref:Helix-turn-helix transcriptional regulator n=1 Tax=Fumia xinanensis TaxID=2763659 RepID=A0A926I6J2_9FIRM|nr:helix-turn-helix transcriptional regulator [Fumia xinanensis]MBC8558857.1 helix-turn-helix transcriptional regulator [Fumia xinanensis]